MRVLMVLGLSLLIAGCGPTVKSSSPNHVTIESYQMNVSKVQQLADAECAKFRRHARMTLQANPREDERNYIFACVE